MQKNHFLLLKKWKNTGSAQLCLSLSLSAADTCVYTGFLYLSHTHTHREREVHYRHTQVHKSAPHTDTGGNRFTIQHWRTHTHTHTHTKTDTHWYTAHTLTHTHSETHHSIVDSADILLSTASKHFKFA